MTGDFEMKSKGYKDNTPIGTLEFYKGNTMTFPIRQMGVNVEPVIGMNPGNNLPIITLGMRYQHSRLQVTENKPGIPDNWFDDIIIGGFISVVFMF